MSESSEDEFDENFGEHGENSGDFDGNFGELDDETVSGLGAVLSDLLENGNTKKTSLSPTPPYIPAGQSIGNKFCSSCTNEIESRKAKKTRRTCSKYAK